MRPRVFAAEDAIWGEAIARMRTASMRPRVFAAEDFSVNDVPSEGRTLQ